MKRIRRWVLRFALLLIAVAAVIVFLGYREYREVISQRPLAGVVGEVWGREGYTQLSDIGDFALSAMIVTEDDRFYQRSTTVDFWALGRALWTNITTWSLSEGGSTIPQQTAKNLYFDHSASLTRKIAEYFVTRDLLAQYSKDQVLELYMNIIYYGDGFVGIHDASIGYFGGLPADLDHAQATLIVGLPQSPANYELSRYYDAAKRRQAHVLDRLVSENIITADEAAGIYEMDVFGGNHEEEND